LNVHANLIAKLRMVPGFGSLHWLGELLAFGAGVSLVLAFAPFSLWPLAVLSQASLLSLVEGIAPRRAARRGWLFGIGLFAVGISWVYISLHKYGNAPAAFAAAVTLVLILYMSLYPTIFAYLLARWGGGPGPNKWLLVAPALWAILEWIRSWLLTGFPWLSLGYSQIDGPLSNIAPYLGVFGVSWVMGLCSGLLLVLLRARGRVRLAWGALTVLLWLATWGLGEMNWVKPDGAALKVSLVQGNMSQDQKWRPEKLRETLSSYAQLSWERAEGSKVIIWPETAIPVFYDTVADFLKALREDARRSGTDYLIGIPTGSWEEGIFYNAVLSLGRSQGFYYKHRLLPFGEYLPLRYLLSFFRDFVDIPLADFSPGQRDQPLLRVANYPVGVSICFEAAFSSEIGFSLPEARFLVNVSNDAWFGDSLAPHQHLEIARMRALEAGRFMARATNTGISAFIDDHGRLIAESDLFTTEVLQGTVQPMRGATPFVRLGERTTVVLLAVALASGLWFSSKSGQTRSVADLRA
jgi:apolipoprotein N-acyltransferase